MHYDTDKRFAVKARLSGILLIVVGLLKKVQDEQEKLVAILKLLQTLSTSSKYREIWQHNGRHHQETKKKGPNSM